MRLSSAGSAPDGMWELFIRVAVPSSKTMVQSRSGIRISEAERDRRHVRAKRARRDRYWRYRHRFGRRGSPRQLAISLGLAVAAVVLVGLWQWWTSPVGEDRHGPVELCNGRALRSCIIDGDTGRDNGKKWRLISVDAPELEEPACDIERQLALAARSRLQELLAGPYKIRPNGRDDPNGRALVDLQLPDGRDVGKILMAEGLAQRWPNRGNVWCAR